MRLYAADELPYHQVPTPFHMVGTSDAHFNDGYSSLCTPRTGTSSRVFGCTPTAT